MSKLQLMTGCTLQKHRRCGLCGKTVMQRTGNRRYDGWFWHYKCWKAFLAPKKSEDQNMSDFKNGGAGPILSHRIDLLRDLNRRLESLLSDPQPGLFTWMAMVPQVIHKMQDVLDGKKDKPEDQT